MVISSLTCTKERLVILIIAKNAIKSQYYVKKHQMGSHGRLFSYLYKTLHTPPGFLSITQNQLLYYI